MRTVKLSYFKESGKYYAEGSFRIDETELFHEIINRVRDLHEKGRLPGLAPGAVEYGVLIQMEAAPPHFLQARLLGPGLKVQQRREDLIENLRVRACENESCGMPLPEGHPGLYCDTQCAVEDA